MKAFTKKGELKVTVADLGNLEASNLDLEDLLLLILIELRKITLHLSSMSGEDITDKDTGVDI